MEEKKKSLLNTLRAKYRLSIYRDESYEEVLNYKLSRLNVISALTILVIIGFGILMLLLVYTPLREIIPGYPDPNTRANIILNQQRIDSLDKQLTMRDQYIQNVNLIISGNKPNSLDAHSDTDRNYQELTYERSREDSVIREMFEMETNTDDLSLLSERRNAGTALEMHFFPPVKGMITNSFNPNANHYGTDLVAEPNEVVKAVLDGTVIMATWTLKTGHVILIQHDNNLISVYKHNEQLLKRVGDYVKVGEAIAMIGNSGELTTGPHLHFELWYNGVGLNPEDYISF